MRRQPTTDPATECPMPAPESNRRSRCSDRVRQPQQRVTACAMITLFTQQQVEGYARHVIGHRLDAGILLLIQDLAVSVALLAGLRAHGGSALLARAIVGRIALERVVSDILARGAAL